MSWKNLLFEYANTKAQDLHLSFYYIDSAIPLLLKSQISSFKPFSVVVQPSFCRTWTETPEDRYSHDGPHMPADNGEEEVRRGHMV